jgi:hypothetical protein
LKGGNKKMVNILGIVIAIIMVIILLGTGAAAEIIGGFSNAMGFGGALAGICIVLGLIFAGFSKK